MFSRLDAIVLNAGVIDPIRRIADANLDEIRQTFETNVMSVFSTLKHALPYLRETKGRVVVVSSGAATGGFSAWAPYSCVGDPFDIVFAF
jgi:NAD(P)-dependent dehydrogenase (short-subunit alcohol dehydrogenase family)